MEVLPEAHGRSSKQREPPRKLAEKKLWRMDRGEAFGSSPTTLRPPQCTTPFSQCLPLFYSSRRGAVYNINYLPTKYNYLGFTCTYFSILYIKGRAHVKGRFPRATHRLRLGTVFFTTSAPT